MSPKTGTLFLFLALIVVISSTLPVSSTSLDHPIAESVNNVSAILTRYGLPGGLFPGNVLRANFYRKSGLLTITLKNRCSVTKSVTLNFFGIQVTETDVVTCDRTISAFLSMGRLDNVVGVTVSKLNPPTVTMKVAKVNTFKYLFEFIEFVSDEGEKSPPFFRSLFPEVPPACDASLSISGSFVQDQVPASLSY